MKTKNTKLTSDLNNGEQFKFKNDSTNYEVLDWIYYRKIGTKKRILLPIKTYVQCYKTI
jgi:hypothetical protein